jgi:pimeloyl-ACP methyl ester carboxylesterase
VSLAPQRGAARPAALRPRPEPHAPRIATARLANGVVLPYVEQGDADGVPVIFLHGVTDSWRAFELVLPHLPPSIHAFAVTQRGHGDASRPQIGYRFADFADDLAAFMDVVGLESAIVVGHSMGSVIAQRFAVDHPDRAVGIVLAGTFWSLRANAGVAELWTSALETLTDPVPAALAREFQESTLAQPIDPAFLDMVVSESLKVPARVWRDTFGGFRHDDVSAELHAITAPTLVIWGDQDAFCPRSDQERVVAAVPGARMVIYTGAGHAMHWEEPARFARDVTVFVDEAVARRGLPAVAVSGAAR